ncbi:unnamed protein product [Didymodactylos carnosus]|uniref:GDT1 family protein n=1 Tax=Didymodactylos carnosus TaxID=1234261 RepID=A0A8S2EIN5_9BILA|nr:unnamed protein product [Didymodactylos carnosus]CAF3985579.1 unnamed protein product [Didymodactylos carnosus]
MALSTRAYVLVSSVILSLLLISLFIYAHNHYQREHKPLTEILLSNGTKIFVNNDKSNEQTKQLNQDWHDKIKDKLHNSANFGFIHALLASLSVIVVSELGDKTFFIAAIMAMRHPRLVIYGGAMGALGFMTILSALLGNIVTKFVPRIYTDGYIMSPDEGTDEYDEVQQDIEKAESSLDPEGGLPLPNGGTSSQQRSQSKQLRTTSFLRRYISPIFLQAFIMTFLAEWGDRSQITTIVLAASENLFGVIVGGTVGHGLCTGLAVLGGRFMKVYLASSVQHNWPSIPDVIEERIISCLIEQFELIEQTIPLKRSRNKQNRIRTKKTTTTTTTEKRDENNKILVEKYTHPIKQHLAIGTRSVVRCLKQPNQCLLTLVCTSLEPIILTKPILLLSQMNSIPAVRVRNLSSTLTKIFSIPHCATIAFRSTSMINTELKFLIENIIQLIHGENTSKIQEKEKIMYVPGKLIAPHQNPKRTKTAQIVKKKKNKKKNS